MAMPIKRELVGPTRQGGFIGPRRALLFRRKQVPSLNIDFSTGSGLASLVALTFTRATTATVTGYAADAVSGASQIVIPVASGEMRIQGARRVSQGVYSNVLADGTPITGTIGYLPEGARTNLCLYSNALTSTWSEVGTTETTQNVTGPDGATSAWTMTDDDGGVVEHRWQGINISSGTTYTYSYFIKKTTGALTAYPVLQVYDPTANKMAGGTIDTTNGTIAKWTAYTGTTMMASFSVNVENFNADYWRVWLTFTAESSNTHRVYFIPAGRSSYSTTGPNDVAATGSAVYYGAQFEAGALPSTYQPTGAAAVARNADVLSCSHTGLLSDEQGTVYVEASVPWTTQNFDGFGAAFIGLGGGSQVCPLGSYFTYAATQINSNDGTNNVGLNSQPSLATGVRKMATTWSGSTRTIAHSGNTSTGAYDGSWGTTGIFIGTGGGSTAMGPPYGPIKAVRIYRTRLSDAQLASLTS